MYCVYLHRRGDNGEVFYVGKGRLSRPADKANRNRHWQNIVNKHGYLIEIVADNISDDYALAMEISLIADYRRKGVPLTNQTKGGEGKSGFVTSEATKVKISNSHKGKVLTQEHKDKVRKAMIGRFVSDETRRKMSENNAFRRPDVKKKIADMNKKPVLRSDGVEFPSAKDARDWAASQGLTVSKDGTSITACCRGRQKRAFGYGWSYKS